MSLGAILIYCGIAATFTVIPFVVDYMYLHRVSPCTFSSVSLYHRPSFCILMYPMYPAGFFNIEKHHGHHCPKEKTMGFPPLLPPKRGGSPGKNPRNFLYLLLSGVFIDPKYLPGPLGHWAIGAEPGPQGPQHSQPSDPSDPSPCSSWCLVKGSSFLQENISEFGDSFLENLWKSMKMSGEKVLWDQRSLSPWPCLMRLATLL